jgi:hypothetical protein
VDAGGAGGLAEGAAGMDGGDDGGLGGGAAGRRPAVAGGPGAAPDGGGCGVGGEGGAGAIPPGRAADGGECWLIVARSRSTEEVKYFASNAAADVPVARLVLVAFTRWNVGHAFRIAKGEAGLTHYEGRSCVGLTRHQILCLVVVGFVAARRGVNAEAGMRSPVAICTASNRSTPTLGSSFASLIARP